MLKKKTLIASVLCAVASVGFVVSASAEETMSGKLDEVVVEASKDVLPGGYSSLKGTSGLLGENNVLDVPFTQMNVTEKVIDDYGDPTQALDSVLRSSPGVRGGGSNLHNDFTIRGITVNGTSTYVNGIPGLMTQFNAPTYFSERIDITTGPNSTLTGTMPTYENSFAGGIVNFVSKKATNEPITRYKQVFSGQGHFSEYLDIGRRFGKNNEWGVRINTELQNGETAIDGQRINAQGIFANIDHVGSNSKTNLLAGYRHLDIKGGARWFVLYPKAINEGDITKLPSAPDSSTDFGFEGMEKESKGYILALNHEQNLSKDWKAFINAGLNDNDLDKNICGSSSRYTIINDAGDLMLDWAGSSAPTYGGVFTTKNHMKTQFAQIGITGNSKFGDFDNTVTVAADKSWRSIRSKTQRVNFGLVSGNLYEGNVSVGDNVFPSFKEALSQKSNYWGASVVDTLKYGKAQLMVGLHKHSATVDSYSSGKYTKSTSSDATCPTYALSYKPTENIALYASHAENFDQGSIVSESKIGGQYKYRNHGQILPPSKVKQNEIGVKYLNKGLLTSLAAFSIKQANNIEEDRADGLYYLQNGEQEYKGIEFSVNGKIAPKWDIMAGLMYLDAKYNKTAGGLKDGVRLTGQANWSGIAGLEYHPDDKTTFLGRMLYMGSAPINNGAFEVPSYTTFDVGVNYKTKIDEVPVKFSLMCYNVTDKDYWMAKSDSLFLSTSRTVVLSATFDI